ncbi:hypothetical protein WOLCODRAFT_147530 [Wolfiporia cocos MD-104 SS10]|uniref:Nucleolar 27S pre-rRNA processing Urb2/Npa2 C-terminal domain-containing protein n=1 Tax=Wolfiporia cocos (strain MD-104) TaxID=742152 RepID=A0A2H3J0X6_WOLCO|nr:hypothetical protein WOLCODRAFT_147530 [Wolfiporia cocos MD-104 SS10]
MTNARHRSAQEFIRALKAPSDPPNPDGPSKVELARAAWDDTAFYLPNKGELIAEWLLTRLLKDKAKERKTNPILDVEYWQLLADVLSQCTVQDAKTTGTARAARFWLLPLLNRIPIAPIVAAYFTLSASELDVLSVGQDTLVSRCLAIVWPLAVPKFSPDSLLDCFGAALEYLKKLAVHGSDENLAVGLKAISLVVSSYRTALSNTANKKKLYSAFLQAHLPNWLQYIGSWDDQSVQSPLQREVFAAGVETLFNAEVLRGIDDQKCDPALKAILNDMVLGLPQVVLGALPRLLESFVQSVKRHKNALFGQGSNHAASNLTALVQAAGLAFLNTCEGILLSADESEAGMVWNARLALLAIVDRENLYNSSDGNATNVLGQIGALAVANLQSSWQEHRLLRTTAAVDILSALTRIDYDLMSPVLPTIWPRLAVMPGSTESVVAYLDHLLEFHSRTRTIDVLVSHWLDAYSIQQLQNVPQEPRHVYQLASSGPLLCFAFLDRVEKAIHGFLTPGQIPEIVTKALRRFEDVLKQFRAQVKQNAADDGVGSRKKRKKHRLSSPSGETHVDPDWLAVEFAMLAKTIAHIINSVPVQSMLASAREELRNIIMESHKSIVSRASKGVLKALNEENRRDTWSWQVVATAALRFHYGLASASHLDLHVPYDGDAATKLRSLILADEILPEFAVEIIRTLLLHSTGGETSPEGIFDTILQHLERHIEDGRADWAGGSHKLIAGSEKSAGIIATLHLLLTRWLAYLESHASDTQLQRLMKLLSHVDFNTFSAASGTMAAHALTVPTVLIITLRNAEFWELRRFRDVFLAQLLANTTPLDSLDLRELLATYASDSTPQLPAANILPIATAYEVLLYAPEEYLSRGSRTDLLRRALRADVVMSVRAREQKNVSSSVTLRPLLVVREFLRRTLRFIGSIDYPDIKPFYDYLAEALPASSSEGSHAGELETVTLETASMHLDSFIKSARQGHDEMLSDVVQSYLSVLNASPEHRGSSDIRERCLLRMIDTLTTNHQSNDFSMKMETLLRQLHTRMVDMCLLNMTRISAISGREAAADILGEPDLLNIWSHALRLGRWLGTQGARALNFSGFMIQQLFVRSEALSSVHDLSNALNVIIEEMHSCSGTEREIHLGYMVAAYLACSRRSKSGDTIVLHGHLANAIKILPVLDFAYLVDYVAEALTGPLIVEDAASLIRLSSLLVYHAPEGTSKVTQNLVTKCLHLFADESKYSCIPVLRNEALSFMNRYFNDRPAAIRSSDMSNIWSILGQLLADSSEHDDVTYSSVFLDIVAIVSALVRLRRDLVFNTLPHLGMILRQLIRSLRGLRPQLAVKQTRLVMNTLPRWVSASSPLGAAESKALARLMTILTTKTIVRAHGQSETQKPESLVRPFSKHAPYVLTAYIDAMIEPLCVVSTQVRRELEPGLFALCEMLGEHDRDAMMVSALDASGKAAMKALWKEYDKQRYTGRG